MLVNKQAYKINEELVIELPPVIGLTSLSSYNDNIGGETINRYFNKLFSYSIDGIHFSEKIELTNTNLSNIEFNQFSIFIIKLFYKRVGNDDTGVLNFNTFDFIGNYATIDPINYFHYNKSLYKDFFDSNSQEVLNWAVNVLQKLYYPNILPIYLTRGEDNNNSNEDEDFIAFWFTVTHFIGLIVNYARIFQNFETNKTILSEYLRQKDIIFCSENITLDNLTYLMNNFYREIAERGSIESIKIKNINNAEIDGEVRRVICWKNTDEFSFALTPRHKFGWNIGNSSPLYKTLPSYYLVNKLLPLESLDVLNGNFNINDNRWILSANSEVDLIGINPLVLKSNLTYLLELKISKENNTDAFLSLENLLFKDSSNNNLNGKSAINGLSTQSFFNNFTLNFIDNGEDYLSIKCIIYNSSTPNLGINGKLNIGVGNHIILLSNIDKISNLKLKVLNSTTGEVYLKEATLRVARTDYSRGFIQTNHLVEALFINNNQKRNFEQIRNLIRELFIPYNSWLKLTDLSNIESNIKEEFYWLPDDPYCEVVETQWEGGEYICEIITWQGTAPYCILKDIISWQGTAPYCILDTNNIITWQGTAPYCIQEEPVNNIISWQGTAPYCIKEDTIKWLPINGYCDSTNLGFLIYPERQQIINNIVTLVEPNLPGVGMGPYFPPIFDNNKCPIEPHNLKISNLSSTIDEGVLQLKLVEIFEESVLSENFLTIQGPTEIGMNLFVGAGNKIDIYIKSLNRTDYTFIVEGTAVDLSWNLIPTVVDYVGILPDGEINEQIIATINSFSDSTIYILKIR